MASILVVCTGNICRSPIAEGFLRRLFAARRANIDVSSAGTAGMDGSEAMPESVAAALERGADVASHRARRLLRSMVEEADVVVGMAAEHRDRIVEMVPEVAERAFTLKELVRLLETIGPADPDASVEENVATRVPRANAARASGTVQNQYDLDVPDPLGLGVESYRAVAWELDEWCARLVDGLIGASTRADLQTAEG